MIDILLSVGLSALGAFWGFLGAYVAFKRLMKPDLILDFSDVLLNEIATNVEYQKKLYMVGGLIGQGLKKGVGLDRKAGKFSWEDLAAQVVGGFVQNLFQKSSPQESTSKNGDSVDSPISQV